MPATITRPQRRESNTSRPYVKFDCEHCGKVNRVPSKYAGRKGKCPGCRQVVRVPASDGPRPRGERRPRRSPPAKAPKAEEPAKKGATKACPMCGETIKAKALKCRFCGEGLDERVERRREREEAEAKPGAPIVLKIWGVLILGLCALGLLGTAVAVANGGSPGGIVGNIVGIFVGLRVFQGQKAGVIGCAVLGALGLAGGLLLGAAMEPIVGVVVVGLTAVVYGPPAVAGFMSWDRLE